MANHRLINFLNEFFPDKNENSESNDKNKMENKGLNLDSRVYEWHLSPDTDWSDLVDAAL